MHDRAVEALVGHDEVGATGEDEQGLVGIVDLADGVDELVGGLDGHEPRRRAADPHRRQVGQGDAVLLAHEMDLPAQSRTATARARPRTFSPPLVAVSSTVTRLVSGSAALTTPETSMSAPVS